MAGYQKLRILLTEELDELEEEGRLLERDVFLREIETCGDDRDRLLELYDKLRHLPMRPDFPYQEPSDYEEILAAVSYTHLSYNTYVSKFLLATDISERREMSGSVLSLLNNTEKLNENIFQILLLDRQANLLSSNGSVYSVNSGLGYSYYSMVDPAMLTDPLLTESYADGTLQLASPLNVRLYSYCLLYTSSEK